jgi:uncharacterized protein with von Willebrand factor type A (vWA) domain
MANVFLTGEHRDIETAIMLEKVIRHDIGNAVAYTDGNKVFLNTEDNLFNILPNYGVGMLKWLLWHERVHNELRHHNRFFKYIEELDGKKTKDKFNLEKEEVNIIMDILVHDSLSKWFPELVETAISNLAQMRNRNSLMYTFETATLEEMLEEYRNHKEEQEGEGEGKGKDSKEVEEGEPSEDGTGKGKGKKKKDSSDGAGEGEDSKSKEHGAGGTSEEDDGDTPEDGEPKVDETKTRPEPEHDKTDWSKLDNIDSEEFITKEKSYYCQEQVNELRRKKIQLGKVTETLNGLATSTRRRTYAKPNPIKLGGGAVLKGSTPGKAMLYLCFDASGSMGGELQLFKEIISKSIPQAMECPCEWFSGRGQSIRAYKREIGEGYFKGKFKDIMPVRASSGFSDDGDRVIELCWQAEQLGYSPIGVTDGGGQLSWSVDKLKQLKRTVLVGQNHYWLEKAKSYNPKVQILDI